LTEELKKTKEALEMERKKHLEKEKKDHLKEKNKTDNLRKLQQRHDKSKSLWESERNVIETKLIKLEAEKINGRKKNCV